MTHQKPIQTIDAGLLDLLKRERAKSLSAREWKFRLAGIGYAIRTVGGTEVLMSLPQGRELGALPAHLH